MKMLGLVKEDGKTTAVGMEGTKYQVERMLKNILEGGGVLPEKRPKNMEVGPS